LPAWEPLTFLGAGEKILASCEKRKEVIRMFKERQRVIVISTEPDFADMIGRIGVIQEVRGAVYHQCLEEGCVGKEMSYLVDFVAGEDAHDDAVLYDCDLRVPTMQENINDLLMKALRS
jgi:hypothetical protein